MKLKTSIANYCSVLIQITVIPKS